MNGASTMIPSYLPFACLAARLRNSQRDSSVIPGKLAIAGATRNLGIFKTFGCRFPRHDGSGDTSFVSELLRLHRLKSLHSTAGPHRA